MFALSQGQKAVNHRYPFFPAHELACKCGCGRGEADMDPVYMDRLIQLRRIINQPLPLSSAFRCPAHNVRVSSTGPDGPHTTGRAVDIQASGKLARQVLDMAVVLKFTGIGINQKGPHDQRFIHIDDLDGPMRPWTWSY